MKMESKVVALSLALGLAAWVLDAIFDRLFVSSTPWWSSAAGLLLLEVSREELFHRLLILACFLLFGLMVGRILARNYRTEQARRDSERQYQSLFQGSNAVMLIIDPESGAILDANGADITFYGYSLEVLKTKKITDINILPAEHIFQEMSRAASKLTRVFHFQHQLASGRVRDVEVHSGPIEMHGRQLLFSIVHDISERRQAEEALRRREEEYRLLVKNIPAVVFRGYPD